LAFPFRGAKIVKLGPTPSSSDNFFTRPSTETGFQNGKIALKKFFEMGSSFIGLIGSIG
jgi:hypothetical protein